MNGFKTFMLMLLLTAIFMIVGEYAGGKTGMMYALAAAIGTNALSYWFSDKLALASCRAQPIAEEDNPKIYQMVRSLCGNAGLPMPKIYRIPTDQPNAFATGRDPHHSAVAVTDGIMRILDDDELEGVLGHELTHVKNRDILISTIAATMAGAIASLSRLAAVFGGRDNNNGRGNNALAGVIVLIFAGIAASLIQMAVSRSREYMADAGGAKISGKPWALANALHKLEMGVNAAPLQQTAANETMSHMYIVCPFSADLAQRLFSTHPPTADRIAKLNAMCDNMDNAIR
ncbi:MAG: zinc metalloprotease HtpX [Abditibacteriota bacterium]|nr:zinc metalloprotease HtpX [Abditibacteriota bacterium]